MTESLVETDSLRPTGSRVLLDSRADAPHTRAVARAWERYGFRVSLGGDIGPGEETPDIYCAVSLGNAALGGDGRLEPLQRSRAARVLAAMGRRGSGRAVLVTDAGPHVHGDATPEAASQRAADAAWWQHLAKRAATRGVLANTVRVGYAPCLGHRLDAEAEGELLRHLVSRRPTEWAELAAALRLLASRGFGNVAGEVLPLDGGLDSGTVPMPSSRAPRPQREEGAPADLSGLPDPFGMDGQTVLVTGASSGIGASIARECAERGADVVLVARRRPELEKAAEQVRELGRNAWVLTADLSDPAGVPTVVDQAWEVAGGVDALVYAAGVVAFDGTGDNSHNRERLLSLNTLSYAAACDALVERWRSDGRAGAVAAVSSLAAVSAPVANLASYGVSKAATALFTAHLATTAARHRVRANSVLPGFVRTPMMDVTNPAFLEATNRLVPTGRLSEPEEIASLVCYLVSPAAAGLSGARLRVDGGGHTLIGLPPLGGGRSHNGKEGNRT